MKTKIIIIYKKDKMVKPLIQKDLKLLPDLKKLIY
jgi:hypothetical protein